MRKPPSVPEIKAWLKENNPLGLFGGDFSVSDIDPKPWSGHFNFLVAVGEKKLVLRFKGPEWGDPASGIVDEYEILKAVEKYAVGPRAYFLAENFFGEPAMIEEYLDGMFMNAASPDEQRELVAELARFIAKINSMKLPEEILRRQEKLFSYERHKRSWAERLEIAKKNPGAKAWAERIEREIIPKAEKMLDEFEHLLEKTLKDSGPVFVFKSAHVGHCLKTENGFRFLNWEKNGFGDPSFSLAVFLASVQKHPRFSEIKKRMVEEYLKERPVPEFAELIEQRLKEREISNLTWVLWAYANKKDTRPIKDTGVQERFERASELLRHY